VAGQIADQTSANQDLAIKNATSKAPMTK